LEKVELRESTWDWNSEYLLTHCRDPVMWLAPSPDLNDRPLPKLQRSVLLSPFPPIQSASHNLSADMEVGFFFPCRLISYSFYQSRFYSISQEKSMSVSWIRWLWHSTRVLGKRYTFCSFSESRPHDC
jgi:hypothetical protein